MQEDPAPTRDEQESQEQLPELQDAEGAGHGDDGLPGDDPPDEPIHES